MDIFWIYLNENTPDDDSEVLVKIDDGSEDGAIGLAHYYAEHGFWPAKCYTTHDGRGEVVFVGKVVAYTTGLSS